MSFLVSLFGKTKEGKSVALIDIGPASVAGAYVHYAEGELPAVLYTRRLPVEMHANEEPEQAMLRALQILGDTLIREGAPILAQQTGSGSAEAILVAIDSPWQSASVRTEHFEEERPFTFNRSIVAQKLRATATTPEGKMLVDESVIGSILNGYETRDPYGKEARRASIVVLTSLIDERVASSAVSILRGIFHTKHVHPIAGSSLRYQALQMSFPHERDALMLDATGPFTSVALVRKGLLIFLSEVEVSRTDTAASWVERVSAELAELARCYPLPRTIFLLARETETAVLRETLDAADLGKLWLSDDPPRIVSVLASHVVTLVRHVSSAPPDLALLLMALYVPHADLEERV